MRLSVLPSIEHLLEVEFKGRRAEYARHPFGRTQRSVPFEVLKRHADGRCRRLQRKLDGSDIPAPLPMCGIEHAAPERQPSVERLRVRIDDIGVVLRDAESTMLDLAGVSNRLLDPTAMDVVANQEQLHALGSEVIDRRSEQEMERVHHPLAAIRHDRPGGLVEMRSTASLILPKLQNNRIDAYGSGHCASFLL